MESRDPYSPHIEGMIDFLDLRSYAASMSPEEYVARTAHTFYLMGPFAYRHPDAQLDAWMGRVEGLISQWMREIGAGQAPTIVDSLRRQYLTPAEIARVEAAGKEEP